jgi:hypothetical protein
MEVRKSCAYFGNVYTGTVKEQPPKIKTYSEEECDVKYGRSLSYCELHLSR